MTQITTLILLATLICFAFPLSSVYGRTNSSLASALIVGTDSNGKTLFLCRASLFDTVQIGFTWTGAQHCAVPHQGIIHFLTHYGVPRQTEFEPYLWADDKDKAITIGRDAHGKPLFLCQAFHNSHLLPGITWPGHRYCNIMYQNKEVVSVISHVFSKR